MRRRRGVFLAVLIGLASAGASLAAEDPRPPTAEAEAAPMFAITYRAGPKWKAGVPMRDQGLRDHFFYWKALHERGIVAIAGPVGDDGGLVLVHATSQADADALIAADPAAIAGIFVGRAAPFMPRFVGGRMPAPVRP